MYKKEVVQKVRINYKDYHDILIVYGDNILESIEIIEKFINAIKNDIDDYKFGFLSLAEHVYFIKFKGNELPFCFIAKAFYHNGDIPEEVRKLVKNLDKPDAIIFSERRKKVLMGFESTQTTLAGNATWQRSGRVVSFAEKGIPFAFLAYHSKVDRSQNPLSVRKPSALFVLFFIAISLKYHTPSLIGFYEHLDKSNWINKSQKAKDYRENIFYYLKDLILDMPVEGHLKECYDNMKNYYFQSKKIVDFDDEFGNDAFDELRDANFAENVVSAINNKSSLPLISERDLFYNWKPVGYTKKIDEMFSGIKFFQMSKHCKAGITFETDKIFEKLQEKRKEYIQDHFINGKENPTIIILIKLTKKERGELKNTDDPYNGEISAFYELYSQSFPNLNTIAVLTDHTVANEYDVEKRKTSKVYKSISKYVNLLIDMDMTFFSSQSENSTLDMRKKYEVEISEDNVTSFFANFLRKSNTIELSYVNPPSGSWSDFQLFPHVGEFYYYKRNDKRGDIAFYNKKINKYYFIECKDAFNTFVSRKQVEWDNLSTMSKTILKTLKKQFKIQYPSELVAVFAGNKDEANDFFQKSKFEIVISLEESNDKIIMHLFGDKNEIPWK